MIYLQFIVSDIFKYQNDQCPDYLDELFCPFGGNGVTTRSSNKKLKLPFRKTKKLGIQSLSYVRPNTRNSLTDNLKSAISVRDHNGTTMEVKLCSFFVLSLSP